jgi:putative alpha-1,2-mannosidase
VHRLTIDGNESSKSWLPESFVRSGGKLKFTVASRAHPTWGTGSSYPQPSFAP